MKYLFLLGIIPFTMGVFLILSKRLSWIAGLNQKVLSTLTDQQLEEVSTLFGSSLIGLGLYNLVTNYLISKSFELYGPYFVPFNFLLSLVVVIIYTNKKFKY
ncbi:MAG TPA: hypothetical protein GX741_02585 [Erysipelothrix sp.]|nr:hypothetical protein [Erysipelothrix sp.]